MSPSLVPKEPEMVFVVNMEQTHTAMDSCCHSMKKMCHDLEILLNEHTVLSKRATVMAHRCSKDSFDFEV